jgi:hypothetical protein
MMMMMMMMMMLMMMMMTMLMTMMTTMPDARGHIHGSKAHPHTYKSALNSVSIYAAICGI